MAAKASRIHILFLLIALTVGSLTATVTVSPSVATAAPNGPQNSGDPDRPNDCPKPAYSPNTGQPVESADGDRVGVPTEDEGGGGWSWIMELIATLLGRRGL
jgi:hypothetical protein